VIGVLGLAALDVSTSGAREHSVGRVMRIKRRSDGGAAAVEFALILPVVLLVIFGIIDFGRMLNAQITLTEAAREAARATALIDAAAGQERFDRVAESTVGNLTPDITACPATPVPGDDAVVDATYTFTFVTPLSIMIGGDGTTNLSGHGVMPCVH